MHPVATLILAWVIDCPVQPNKCYILAVTWGIWALPDMHTLCLRAARACSPWAYISGKALMPVLQLLRVTYV